MAQREDDPAGSPILPLVVVGSVAGALTGLVAAGFGVLLDRGGDLRSDVMGWAHDHGLVGVLAAVGLVALTTTLAAFLVHRVEPHAEGSGIPRVTAAVQGHGDPGRLRILPVKFVGGLLAIGGGLALGREGPSVQMGGMIGAASAKVARLRHDDLRMIMAGGAAAGLATAFNAPIAGGVFVLEELLRRFDHRSTLAALSASGAGLAATHLVGADAVVFDVPDLPTPSLGQAPLVLAVGLVCGVMAVLHNRAVLGALRVVDTTPVPWFARAAVIGGVVGVVACWHPGWVGSGDALTEGALAGTGVMGTVVLLLVVRLAIGVLSYAANTPGGLFAPMLVLGSHLGLLVALLASHVVDLSPGTAAGLALVGLAAFFAGSVQAPVTGLILATEMTGSATWLAPMLGASAVAMLVARVLRSRSIYDDLAERSVRLASS